MHKSPSRYFTLFEVLIAMALTFILMSVLMSSYLQISKINLQLEKDQEESFKKLYLSTRLAGILPQTVSPNHKDKDFFFFSGFGNDSSTKNGSQTLVFTFDNGVKLDPAFSNHVIGRIYLNTSDELCLAIWPSPARLTDIKFPSIKHEVLFEKVRDLHFEFYMPPERNRKLILQNNKRGYKNNDLLKATTLGEWKTEWQQEYKELPPLIKIILTLYSSKVSLIYPLPQSNLIIVYE